jgi:hypothetical protein
MDFDTALAAFVTALNANRQTAVGKTYPNGRLETTLGPRYVRIISVLYPEKASPIERAHCCFGFVDTTNGDILKSAGWNGPAKNFARGSIYKPDEYTVHLPDWVYGIR